MKYRKIGKKSKKKLEILKNLIETRGSNFKKPEN